MISSLIEESKELAPDQTLVALEATHNDTTDTVASWVLQIVDWILQKLGLGHSPNLETWLYAAVVFGLSLVIGYIAKWIILSAVRRMGPHINAPLYSALTNEHFFTKVCRMVPALAFLIFIQFTLVETKSSLAAVLTKLTLLYVIYVTMIAVSALITVLWRHFDARENKRHLPLQGILQLVKGLLWIVAAIIAVAVIVNRSPASLLAGLGAFAAVLMLVFKDSILGVVAGVQLSENDSLHVGDWIKVNGTDANGTVTEVNLTAIKVQNWDKTTTSIPPYSLVTGSFTNYRSMQESHTRRICRTYMIDADSIAAATPELLDRVRKVKWMDDFITKKLAQRESGKVEDVNNSLGLPDGTIDTNLGLFRAYAKYYLDNCPFVDRASDCFVSTLQQTGAGVPFQIYCFTNTSAWFAYEAMQDTIFEHIATMLAMFDLYTFENPSGRDTILEGYLSGNEPRNVVGIPVPFFKAQDPSGQPTKPVVAPESAPAPDGPTTA